MTYPAWTPASRPGIIPLHPLSFGTMLGRSFSALRQNPRVLLGFALGVQLLAYLVLILAVGGVAWAAFSRLETLRPGTDDFQSVLAGSTGITIAAAVVLGLAVGALSAIVQGVVVREVAHAAVAEEPTLRELRRSFTPVAWRLIGYSFLLLAAGVALIAVVAVGIFLIGVVAPPAAIAATVLLVLAAIPGYLWLTTKLLLVPSAIVLERATIGGAIARSWRLTRGRFWAAFGIVVLISLIFGTMAQVVSIPFSLVSAGFTTILSPTGEPTTGAIVGFLVTGLVTQVLTLVIQAVTLVVQGTASALVYIDCRMRHEGLDLDLLQYVDARDAGAADLPDPYTVGIGRSLAPRPVASAPRYPVYGTAYPAPAPYPGQPHAAPGSYPWPGQAGPYPGPAYGPQGGYAPAPYGYPPAQNTPAHHPSDTPAAAPGSPIPAGAAADP
ncbi:hypothetical protein, partial [Microbacterium ulmi]